MDIKKIISELSLEEKASLCSGEDFWHTKTVQRLGIPSVMVSDGPHGLRKQAPDSGDKFNQSIKAVCFPAACALACSFDRDLLFRLGQALGNECQAENVSIILGPGTNIKRSPLCGRNFEYFSEDPLLSGLFASALTKGVQSHRGKGVTIKHFACNNQETNRTANNSIVSEKALREIYLRGFEICINESNPMAMMSSYNLINGVHSSDNRNLINGFLFEENGYQGFVMTDWIVNGMYSKKDKHSAPIPHLIANSGTSLLMPGRNSDVKEIEKELAHNEELKEQIKINIARIVNVRN